ncbi:MAG: hypothetical protein V4529_17205 [Gemmatimonadota bacterium]
MAKVLTGFGLYNALKVEGYTLPDECADVELRIPVDGVMQLALIVNLTEVTLAQVGRAFIRMAEGERS